VRVGKGFEWDETWLGVREREGFFLGKRNEVFQTGEGFHLGGSARGLFTEGDDLEKNT